MALVFSIIAFSCIYALFLSGAQSADVSLNFYFLVSGSTHIQAGAYQAQLLGGAGYTLRMDGREYVALSVYMDITAAEQALENVEEGEKGANLLVRSVGKLYFKTADQKKNATGIAGAFDSLYGNIQILNAEISRLVNGATQESSKRLLSIVNGHLGYLGKEYEDIFPEYAKVCLQAQEELKNIAKNIVFVKDLRYVLCYLCQSYADLSTIFCL